MKQINNVDVYDTSLNKVDIWRLNTSPNGGIVLLLKQTLPKTLFLLGTEFA